MLGQRRWARGFSARCYGPSHTVLRPEHESSKQAWVAGLCGVGIVSLTKLLT